MNSELHINDLFFTFQGEGRNSGRRALFVRMPFCNLSCSWCDTTFNTFNKWSEQDFLAFAEKEKCGLAVITGGEPLMHKHTPRVVELLSSLGFELAVETNGTQPLNLKLDLITVSPKRDADYVIHESILDSETDVDIKYVVDAGFDFSTLDVWKDQVGSDCRRLYLSPEWNNFEQSSQQILNYIKENPQWRFSLQTHKFLKIP